jgi:hypothetical protein
MGNKDLTDGVWLWPEGLSHYVINHGIILPEEFIADSFAGAEPRQPHVDEAIDFSFWVQWSAARRSPRLVELFRSARLAAEAEVIEAMRKHVEFMARDKGLSEPQCQWINCTQKALAGMALCSEHCLWTMDSARFEVAFFTGLREQLSRI